MPKKETTGKGLAGGELKNERFGNLAGRDAEEREEEGGEEGGEEEKEVTGGRRTTRVTQREGAGRFRTGMTPRHSPRTWADLTTTMRKRAG
jgi:hypothetical protein